jgi:tungstate transport system substrate-binding protein
MRRSIGSSGSQRALLAVIALLAALVVVAIPASALAAISPGTITIQSTIYSMANAKPFVMTGKTSPAVRNRTIAIEVKRPGGSVWSYSSARVTDANGNWFYRYNPRIAGRSYFRARYSVRVSRVISVFVAKAPIFDVILASTTSTQDSGLFDEMIPAFQKAYPWYKVKVIAVGSGEALKLGEKKDADVLLVHSPAAERTFIANGFGKNRKDVMYNDFLVVGPASDPAGVKTASSAVNAFSKMNTAIGAGTAKFLSRGDNSGTHSKEKSLWALANVAVPTPGTNYISTGQGMGECLRMAGEMGGYTLVDRATWLANKPTDLVVEFEGDPNLFNQYGVIEVIGAKQPEGAASFSNWITGPAGQTLIRNFGRVKYGRPLFIPNAI